MKEVVPLRKHIQQFATVCANITEVLGKAKADELISKSIYIISVGSNDIFEYSANATVLPDIFMANLIEAYTIHIEELYNLGAKKFGVLSVGPLGCVPVMRALDKNGSCADPMNQLAQAFYTVVSSLLQQLSSQYQGFNYSLGNLYDVTMSTILNYIVEGKMVSGLDHGIVTMKKGGRALFTLPPKLAYGEAGTDGVPPNSVINFQVELISWITVIDVFKDGGLIKRVLVKGKKLENQVIWMKF